MDSLEIVEDGEIAETTPPLPVSVNSSGENFQVPYDAAFLSSGDNSGGNLRYGSDQSTSSWPSSSDLYERRQQHKGSSYPPERTQDLSRNQTGQPLLLSGQSSHPPRQPYPRQPFPNPNRNRGRSGTRPMPPPPNFSEKRSFYPRGVPPRSNYAQPWNSGKPMNNSAFTHPTPAGNDHPDYSRGSPNYYGPSSTSTPTSAPRPPPSSLPSPALSHLVASRSFQPKSQLSPAPPLETPLSRPQPIAPMSNSNIPPPPILQPPLVKVVVEDEATKPKPQPLIQVVTDPNLSLDPPKTTIVAPKLPPSVIPSNSKPYSQSRTSYLNPSHLTSPTNVSISRLIDHVAAPTNPAPTTPLPLAVTIGLHEESSLLNLPPPPSLEGASESSGSISSGRARPRVAWGQGLLRRKSVDIEVPQTPSSPKAENSQSFQSETETEPPHEKFLEIDEDPVLGTLMEVVETEDKAELVLEDKKVSAAGEPVEQEQQNVEVKETLTVEIPRIPVEPGRRSEAAPLESPRSKGKPGRPSSEDVKSAKKSEKKPEKKKLEPKLAIIRKKSFDETNDSESDGNKPDEAKKRRAPGRGNAADSDKESVEDEAPRKKRGRPPSGAIKASGPSSPVADDFERDRDNQQSKGARGRSGRRVGRPKSDSESISSYQILPPPPVKRRSRSFGSFERDSLGGLFSSVSDLRNAYYALQGMVRIQVGMRGVSGFNKEDLMGLNQMLQNPQSVVNLPIPYTSEIVMCLEIIEAKSYQYGDAMVAIQLLRREIEDLPHRSHHFKSHSKESASAASAPQVDSLHPFSSSPMGLVKKSAIKSEAQSPNKKPPLSLWPEPLIQQFMAENVKRVSAAEICAHVHFPPSLPAAASAHRSSFEGVVDRGREELERKRSVVLAEIRRRKLARTQAWEILADRYVAVKHRWAHYDEKNNLPVAGEEEVLGPRLRAVSSMRNILGPRAPARLSTMRASSDILLQDQDRVLQQLAMKELMARRLAVGICPIPDMLSPWQHSDPSVPPRAPSWPPSDMYLPDIEPEERYTSPPEDFPKSVGDSPVIIDINGCRLTTDGRRPLCAVQPSCPPNCNCALQVDREERKFHPWSDMEKTIFLDKFMQFPKNFSKIAAFLTNRTTKDCVKFYYDSKTTIPYKSLLREFDNRKRHLRNSWTHSCAAANSVGGVLFPPDADEKEHIAELPADDVTYRTFCSHPLYMATALGFDRDDDSEKGAYRKKQMAEIQHRPPRERTQLLSVRRELRRESFKLFGGNGLQTPYYGEPDSGTLKTFTYPADVRSSEGCEPCEGYGQSDSWIHNDGSSTRHRRHREAGNLPKDMASAKEIDAALARGRGRGRRGRRPNTISRGSGRPNHSEGLPPLPENKLSPLSRGRGRGRGRWSTRGRGRGRGRGDDASQGFAVEKDEDGDGGFDPTDESFDQTEELDYEGGEEDDEEEYDGQGCLGVGEQQQDDTSEMFNSNACEEESSSVARCADLETKYPVDQDQTQQQDPDGDQQNQEDSIVVAEVVTTLLRAVSEGDERTDSYCSADPILPLCQEDDSHINDVTAESNEEDLLAQSSAKGQNNSRVEKTADDSSSMETKRKFSEMQGVDAEERSDSPPSQKFCRPDDQLAEEERGCL